MEGTLDNNSFRSLAKNYSLEAIESQWIFDQWSYHTHAIISCGLYISYPIFHYSLYCGAVYQSHYT